MLSIYWPYFKKLYHEAFLRKIPNLIIKDIWFWAMWLTACLFWATPWLSLANWSICVAVCSAWCIIRAGKYSIICELEELPALGGGGYNLLKRIFSPSFVDLRLPSNCSNYAKINCAISRDADSRGALNLMLLASHWKSFMSTPERGDREARVTSISPKLMNSGISGAKQ